MTYQEYDSLAAKLASEGWHSNRTDCGKTETWIKRFHNAEPCPYSPDDHGRRVLLTATKWLSDYMGVDVTLTGVLANGLCVELRDYGSELATIEGLNAAVDRIVKAWNFMAKQ